MKVRTDWKAHSHALEDVLRNAEYGKSYTFEELTKIAGVDIQEHRHLIPTLRRCLLKHHKRLLTSIKGIGYSISMPNQCEKHARDQRVRAYRSTKKAFQICRSVPLDSLTSEERNCLVNEEIKNGALLVTYKVLEQKRLGGKENESLKIPTDSDVIRALLDKS